MSQIFDGGGTQSGVGDDSGLLSSALEEMLIASMVVPPQPVPSQVASSLGQDGIPAMWPGSMHWEKGIHRISPAPIRQLTAVHTWYEDSISTGNFNINNDIFPNHATSVSIRRILVNGDSVKRMIVVRRWTGLGGSPMYIPSFPQLSRQETAYPHAT